jgi:hypothetical protein
MSTLWDGANWLDFPNPIEPPLLPDSSATNLHAMLIAHQTGIRHGGRHARHLKAILLFAPLVILAGQFQGACSPTDSESGGDRCGSGTECQSDDVHCLGVHGERIPCGECRLEVCGRDDCTHRYGGRCLGAGIPSDLYCACAPVGTECTSDVECESATTSCSDESGHVVPCDTCQREACNPNDCIELDGGRCGPSGCYCPPTVNF